MQASDPTRGIDKADHALLNAVAEDEWAAYLLGGEEPTEDIMNKPSHGLSERGLTDHFFRLWNQGLIECRFDEFEAVVAPDFEVTRQQFEHTKDWPPAHDHSLVYRLTRSGGELWEHFASPDWDKVLNNGVGSDPNEYTLSASNRGLIELSLGCRGYIFPPAMEGTEKWETVKPWQATYWKTLPTGCGLVFRYDKDWREPARANEAALKAWIELSAVRVGWCKSFQQACEEHFLS